MSLANWRIELFRPGRKIPFVTDPELDRKLTESELRNKLLSYKGEIVQVTYRDKTGKGTLVPPRILNDFAVEASGQEGVNIVTLYLRGFPEPLFLYQSNLEMALD